MQPCDEIKNIVLSHYGKFDSGEQAKSLEELYPLQEGVVIIGNDPIEWLEGHQVVLDHYRQALPPRDEYRVVVDHLDAYCESNVGWVITRPVFVLGKGGKVTTRLTAVLNRENGK